MIKALIVPAVLISSIVASSVVQAQSGRAPCDSFQRLADGKWKVIKLIKIENGQTSVMLSAGTIIAPGTKAAGADLYAALQKTCH
jgi:hypothetical protein